MTIHPINPKLFRRAAGQLPEAGRDHRRDGLRKHLTKAVLEQRLLAEMTAHLGYEKHDPIGHNGGNSGMAKRRRP